MMQGGRRLKKHDYHQKKYTNPLFQRRRKSSFDFGKIFSLLNLRSTVSVILIMAIFLGIAWFLFLSKAFLINNIALAIPAKYSQAEINQLTWQEADQKLFFLSHHNLLLFDTKSLTDTINERYTVSNLKIIKKFPHTLAISFEDKVYRLLWQENGHNYFISPEDGIAKEVDLNFIKADGLPVIINSGAVQISQDRITDPATARFILNIFTNISKNTKYKIENFRVGDDIGLVEVKFQNGPIVKTSTQAPLDKQLEKLYNIINIKLRDDFNKKTYIDIRYGDTVYIK